MRGNGSTQTGTTNFRKPSEKSIRKVMQILRQAGEEGVFFKEQVSKTGLSKDTVSRCNRWLKDQGLAEKFDLRWRLKPRAIPLLQEVEVWLEQFETLEEELFTVMLERLASIKDELKADECVQLVAKAAEKLEKWKDDYGNLEKLLVVMELLPPQALRRYTPTLKAVLKEYVKKCPRKYVVFGSHILSFKTLEPRPLLLERVFPPRKNERGNPSSYPSVFTKGLLLLNNALRGEEKFQVLMELFREALNVDFSPGGLDIRAHILRLVEDKGRLLKVLIQMSQEEKHIELKTSIKDVLKDFEVFTA